MHPYSIDLKKRTRIWTIVLLVLLTAGTYTFFERRTCLISLLTNLEAKLDSIIPLVSWGYISIVLTPGIIFGIYYYLFENFIWKWRYINKLIGIPNINGKYKGTLESSFRIEGSNEKTPPMKMILTVKQNFDKIKFTCEFPDTPSASESSMGALMLFEDNMAKFIFAYTNQSTDIFIENDQHNGMNTLIFDLSNGSVRGTYFNGRGKKPNKGKMTLDKIS